MRSKISTSNRRNTSPKRKAALNVYLPQRKVTIAAQKATAAYIRIYDQELKDIENTIKYMEATLLHKD